MTAAPVGVVTLLKVSSLQFLASCPKVPGETPDLGLPDETMTTLSVSFSLSGASFWSTRSGWRGLEVEWCYIYRINDDKSRRHGATEYQRRMRDDGLAQGGGAI